MPARIALKLLGKRLQILIILIAAFAIGSNLWQEAIPKVNAPPTAAEWKLSAPLDAAEGRKLKSNLGLRHLERVECAAQSIQGPYRCG